MGQRKKRAERCGRCRMHIQRCICADIPNLKLQTHLAVVMHYRERPKTTATSPLALAALANSKLYIHGERHNPLDLNPLHENGRRVLVLFPSPDAAVLGQSLLTNDPRPTTLVVPDGTWGQAKRMAKRIPGLERAKKITLPTGSPSIWGIRKEHHPDGLATYEAIARALGIIESPDIQRSLEDLFKKMLRATYAARGYDKDGKPYSPRADQSHA